jgi:hypothetical protein
LQPALGVEAPVTRPLLVFMLLGLVAVFSGCAWFPRWREPRPAERLQLESVVISVPPGADWRVVRGFDADRREFSLVNSGTTRSVLVVERDGALPAGTSRAEQARLAADWAKVWSGDAAAIVSELAAAAPPRFGDSASVVMVSAEESAAKAGLLVKHVAYVAELRFTTAEPPHRAIEVQYQERGLADELTAARFEASWRELLDGLETRPASPEHVAAAARADDFPKRLEPGLAHRSLTLPQLGFQWELWRQRWLRPGGFDGSWALRFGVTDQVEVSLPGFVRYSFGEVEALTRPEFAVGVGLTGYQHDATLGSVWSFGAMAQARKRVAANVALQGQLFGELNHEARSGRDRPGGSAVAGVVWDGLPLVSLGLEAGYGSEPLESGRTRLIWIGGSATPLLTLHLTPLDIGLRGAAAWCNGRPGVLAGFSLMLTL